MEKIRHFRLFEMIPGGLVWVTLISAVSLSYFAPLAVIYFIIVFDLFWLFRVTYFVIILAISSRRYKRDISINWFEKASAFKRFDDMYHLVFLPTYKEELEILRTTFKSLAASEYPVQEKFIVILTGEEGDQELFWKNAEALKEEFGEVFYRLETIVHKKGIPGDLPGKGSNIHWAGHHAKDLIDKMRIPYEDVIVSSFDVDTCVHPQYFACLTYKYLDHPNPTRASFQPVALYNNNMWDAPAVVRVAAFGTTFWLMTELARPERLFTFSSHSMSFRALVDVGFWERDIVTEDSRIFLQCLLHYDGDYSVTPIYVPVSMDTVLADTYRQSVVNLYKQQRRWAWGVEHFPYLVNRFWGNKKFPLKKKIYYIWTLMEGMFTWATAPLLIFMLGYLPLWLAPEALRSSVVYQNTPHTLQMLMTLSMLGVFASAIVSFGLLPPRPSHKRRRAKVMMFLQWALVPFTFVIFGAIPAIDAQTRLMLGKHMGFNITEKKRRDTGEEKTASSLALQTSTEGAE